ncbi:M42 family metallopeptidase [Candidatus Latescibacterota bacterium]
MITTSFHRRGFFKSAAATVGLLLLDSLHPHLNVATRASTLSVTTENLMELLQELIYARGPVGQEEEVRVICERELKKTCDSVWIDEAGNVIGLIRGTEKKSGQQESPIVRVMAHMDENAMMVKRVNTDGTLRVKNLGGIRAGVLGQTPVDILADSGILPGVLSIGPLHTSAESPGPHASRTEAIDWSQVYIFTRKSFDELKQAGVHAGTKVVIARERRKLWNIDDCVGGYFMDDRAAIVIALGATALLKEEKKKPANDVYFIMTTQEEIGAVGASYAARKLPGDVTVAVDVGPVANEYKTELTSDPIIAYGDASSVYSKSVSDRLFTLTKDLGMEPQTAVWESYGSDASISKRYGQTARSGLLCIATENTHGYEIIPREGLLTCARLLASYVVAPVSANE